MAYSEGTSASVYRPSRLRSRARPQQAGRCNTRGHYTKVHFMYAKEERIGNIMLGDHEEVWGSVAK